MQAHCLCGGVAFEFEGPCSGIELCHCPRCRRANGSAFSPDFWVRVTDFRWLHGEALVVVYDAPIVDTPPAYRRSFCRNCGSQLPVLREGSAYIRIPAGLIDSDLPLTAVCHINTAKAASWWNLGETMKLPSYSGAAPAEFRAQMLSALLGK